MRYFAWYIFLFFFLRTNEANPYLQFYRQSADEKWNSVMRTECVEKTCDPQWKKIKISVQRLCNGDYSRPLLIKCFHDKDKEAPEEMGQCETTLQELLSVKSKELINPQKSGKKCGDLMFKNQDIIKNYGFLEYVMGGMQIQMIVAIDFTGFVLYFI